jgi:hypothetical protein
MLTGATSTREDSKVAIMTERKGMGMVGVSQA